MLGMAIFRRFKKWRVLAALSLIPIVLLGSLGAIRHSSSGRTYDTADAVPKRKAALVLGCTKILANGRPNLFFYFRIEAAAGLFRAGRVDYLIVSGDNSREGYDEPTDMRDALIAAGVPADHIYRDYAGFRTLDSVIRARDIFGQDSITIVSQRFHNERAIFIARGHGIDAVGYNAVNVPQYRGLKTKSREWLARVKTVLDVWVLGTRPKFSGPPVELGGPVS